MRKTAGLQRPSRRRGVAFAHDRHEPALTTTRPELLEKGRDDRFRELVHACLAFTSRLLAIRDGYAAIIGLSGPQYTMLISIAHLGRAGTVGVRQIADHLRVSGTFVTTETNKLVSAGLIRKGPDPSDGRRVSLSVTAHGAALLERLAPIQQAVNNVHFGPLDREGFRALHRIMGELVTSSDQGLSLLRHLAESESEPL
jgi:DNA-binding MarR family transcriptional regulator